MIIKGAPSLYEESVVWKQQDIQCLLRLVWQIGDPEYETKNQKEMEANDRSSEQKTARKYNARNS